MKHRDWQLNSGEWMDGASGPCCAVCVCVLSVCVWGLQKLPLLILSHESASKKLQLCEMNIYKNEFLNIYGSICISHLHHTYI